MTYHVHFVNFHYDSGRNFNTVQEAVNFAISKCFEATIADQDNKVVAFWSPIGGLRGMR